MADLEGTWEIVWMHHAEVEIVGPSRERLWIGPMEHKGAIPMKFTPYPPIDPYTMTWHPWGGRPRSDGRIHTSPTISRSGRLRGTRLHIEGGYPRKNHFDVDPLAPEEALFDKEYDYLEVVSLKDGPVLLPAGLGRKTTLAVTAIENGKLEPEGYETEIPYKAQLVEPWGEKFILVPSPNPGSRMWDSSTPLGQPSTMTVAAFFRRVPDAAGPGDTTDGPSGHR